ncbi:hypothetical protein ACW7BX_27960 [Klebsiella pneumoniae]
MMSLWDALRMNMMISYQELVRTFLSIVGASYVSYSSWQDRNIGLVPIGKEYLSCQLKSRNEPDPETFRTVTLDCGGEEKMAKEELYDAAVKAAIKYGYE